MIGVFRANAVLHGKQGQKRSSAKARHVNFIDLFLYSLHLNSVAVPVQEYTRHLNFEKNLQNLIRRRDGDLIGTDGAGLVADMNKEPC